MGNGKKAESPVKSRWRDEEAGKLRGVDRLVYRSNTLGSDLTLTNTGGGNTSSKLMETDPLTGESGRGALGQGLGGRPADGQARRLRVALPRAGAGDEGPATSAHPGRGLKTPVEDRMYELYSHCVFNLNPRACSIDTPLHTFVPSKHVDHLHPNAVIAVAASVESGAPLPRDLRRRRDLRPLAAARASTSAS